MTAPRPLPDPDGRLRAALTRYRLFATIVGVLLVVLVLVGVPLANFDGTRMWGFIPWTPTVWLDGSTADRVGETITTYLGVAHGWLYMTFVLFAFVLSRRARWDLWFTVVTLALGTVPLASFWAEHRATRRVQAQLAGGTRNGDAPE